MKMKKKFKDCICIKRGNDVIGIFVENKPCYKNSRCTGIYLKYEGDTVSASVEKYQRGKYVV